MRSLTRLFCLITGLLALVGCEDAERESTIRQRGFVYCTLGQPNTFNPQLTDGGITVDTLSAQIYDRLVSFDQESVDPVPMLAESWSVSEDGKVYTFKLRKGVNFQVTDWFVPHRQLTAEDVVFSFRRLIDPDHPFHFVSGGEYPWFDSTDFTGLVESVDALDDETVRFTLSRPDVSFLGTLATSYAVVLSQEYGQYLLAQGKPEKLDTKPVGTGPFFVDDYHPGDYIRLRRNWSYWQGAAAMEQVVLDISSRGTGNLAKLLTGECDVLPSPVASQLPVIRSRTEFNLNSQTGMNTAYLALDTRHPALSELEVRKAISLAINRSNLISSVYYGTGTEAGALLPPNSWAHKPDSEVKTYDPKLAKVLMAKAGYRNGFDVELAITHEPRPYNPSPRKMAELIQADLAQIGVRVTINDLQNVSRKTIRESQTQGMVLTGWVADSGDPDNFLRPLLSCSAKFTGWNLSNWCNRYFDRALNDAIAVKDRQMRNVYYAKAQEILSERMPVVPLAHGIYYSAAARSLHGLEINSFGSQSFVEVSRGY